MPSPLKNIKQRLNSKKARPRQLLQTISFERGRLLSLINSMADAVLAIDKAGKVLLYNGATLELLNTNTSLDAMPLSESIVFRNEKDQPVDVIDEARKAGHAIKREDLHFVSNEDQRIDLYLDVAPIYSGQSRRQSGGYIMLLRDISKEKSLDEQRTEFISVTSHELRTPIAIAEANISTVLLPALSKNMNKEAKDLLGQAHNQVVFLGELVNDLTTLARAERGDLDLDIKPIAIDQLLAKLMQDYQPEAEAKGLKLMLPANLPKTTINSSELYIHEILQNFITNAIKYSQEGQIAIKAEAKRKRVIFSVQDSGIGISASDKRKVFSKFYRAEDYRTRQTRGTGLGLYITLKLADRLRGKIWFKSKLNSGSTFYLEVPSLPLRQRKSRV